MSEEVRILKIKSCYACIYSFDYGEGLYCCAKKRNRLIKRDGIVANILVNPEFKFPKWCPLPGEEVK
jgi:hypothetical protein